jgi:hypothetical protein
MPAPGENDEWQMPLLCPGGGGRGMLHLRLDERITTTIILKMSSKTRNSVDICRITHKRFFLCANYGSRRSS